MKRRYKLVTDEGAGDESVVGVDMQGERVGIDLGKGDAGVCY